ncbi:hypothetical protein DWC23_26420 [Salmonella enterica]|nr:hypothetical protein [Salmonella enterica]EBI5911845.1 hypothetical protein [Salmonella enterica]
MGSCAAPSAKGDDKFITTDYLQQCPTSTIILLTHSANRESVQSLHLSRRRVGQAQGARQPGTLGYSSAVPVSARTWISPGKQADD